MLEVASLRSPKADQVFGLGLGGDHSHVGLGFPESGGVDDDDFLLDFIDFSTCDMPFFHVDGDILPDLEVDSADLLALDFASSSSPDEPSLEDGRWGSAVDDEAVTKAMEVGVEAELGGDSMDMELPRDENHKDEKLEVLLEDEKDEKKHNNNVVAGDEAVSSAVTSTEDSAAAAASDNKSSSASAEGQSKRTSTKTPSAAVAGKSSHGRRKVKVDWTPELHRRFVQAVEQLGIDKAVPSRILELMGNEYSLTRHNIASHLQKYRSHRKHLMAREAEAASWTQKRQMYAAAAGVAPRKPDGAAAGPWVVPTIGFPPPGTMPPPPPPTAHHPGAQPPPFCRPLHVWGHPSAAAGVDAPAHPQMLPIWPRHLAPPPVWAHQPPVDPAYWHQQYNAARKWGPQAVTQGTPCGPPPMPPPAMMQRFAAPVPGMMPHPMYRPIPPPVVPSPAPPSNIKLAGLPLQLDAHPSKESIDAAIGDVLVKPWLPLPLGLKPPSLDSVMTELHKQGIPKVPPATTTASGGATTG